MSWILVKHHIKTVMITDVSTMTRKYLAGTFPTSVIFTVATQCYIQGSHKKPSLRHICGAASTFFLGWRISPLMMHLHHFSANKV
jgi:hypothetical protein